MQTDVAPLGWLRQITAALQWPVVVVAAFALGRYVQRLETRVAKAELTLQMIIERHMPHIHNALAEIKGLLQGRR